MEASMKVKTAVLYYHRVYEKKCDINLLCVTPKKFEQQMKYLKKNFNILRFEEDWTRSDRDSIVITFDDGYLDNLTYALPILEELQIPATIFVSTGTLSDIRELWWDELETLLLTDGDYSDVFRLQDDIYNCEWRTDTYEFRLNCYKALHYLMKNHVNPLKREKWFEQLWKWRGETRYVNTGNSTLSDRTCQELAKSKYITIGAHTVSHPSLAKLKFEEQKSQIQQSVAYLENLLQKKIDMFSYPFGVESIDFDESTIAACKVSGIRKAASVNEGLWQEQLNPYAIPRNSIGNWGLYEFKSKINKLFGKEE